MRNIEIKSDKYSVLTLCLMLAFILLSIVGNVQEFISHKPHYQARTWSNYLFMVFAVFGILTFVGDPKVRREYPYGFTAGCVYVVALGLRMAFQQGTPGLPTYLELVAGVLALVEIVRWFRARVRIIQGDVHDV